MERIFKNPEVLLPALAEFVVESAAEAIEDHGSFSFVLSGGSSPKKLYELLASPDFRSKTDWSKVFFFFGDERNVPHTDADSNYRMAKLTLFDPLGIQDDHIFSMNTSLDPQDAAKEYAVAIDNFFKGQTPRFDFVLLGLGDNSHTASLFPHTSVLHEKKLLVAAPYIDEVKMYRITFTAPLINFGKLIVFLVYGSGKAIAVKHILRDARNIDEFPAQLIAAEDGHVMWFMDEAASSNL